MIEVRAGLFAAAAAIATVAFSGTADARSPALRSADAPAAQLDRVSSSDLPGGAEVTRYSQEVDGVEVFGAGVAIVDPQGGPPAITTDKSIASLDSLSEPQVTERQARRRALDALGNPASGTTRSELVIDATRANQLVWRVAHYSTSPLSDWVLTISAETGELLAKEDRLVGATGQASVFVPNAVVANDGYDGLKDRGDRDSAKLTALRDDVLLEDLVDGQSCLKGEWAQARMKDKEKKVCKESLDWTAVTRQSDRFEALMAYHHITEVQQYFQSLGITDANAESQYIVVDHKMPAYLGQDNSFYSPGSDQIRTGYGGVDDAEDADVIVHEYGHAVQDDQAPSAFSGTQGGAMGEGFGDYLAAVYQSEAVGPDPEWTPCIMEWDATAYDFNESDGICLRRADDPDSRSDQADDCGPPWQDIHCFGQIWSSALLDLRNELGDDVGGDSIMDKLVLSSHDLLVGRATYNDAAGAIMDADTAIYGGMHCADLSDEFADREFGSFNC